MSVSASFTVESDKCCHSSVTVSTNVGTRCVGGPQGRRCYLSGLNDRKFEQPVALEGTVTLFETKSSVAPNVVWRELASEASLVSVTRAKDAPLYAVLSGAKVSLASALNVVSVIELKF